MSHLILMCIEAMGVGGGDGGMGVEGRVEEVGIRGVGVGVDRVVGGGGGGGVAVVYFVDKRTLNILGQYLRWRPKCLGCSKLN